VVEEMARDKKVITLHFRRRKNSKNVQGFRRDLTILRIQKISLNADLSKDLGV
jgi:ribosomal protein L21